jgi:hypothetical protein
MDLNRGLKETFRFKEGFSFKNWAPHIILFLVLILLLNKLASAQISEIETDRGIVASIAPYEKEVRQSILIASKHPDILSQIQQSQDLSIVGFQKTISGCRQAKQAWFYTLTRYPELMHNLSLLPKGKTRADVYTLLPAQDASLQKAAWKLYKHNQSDLVEIDRIQHVAQAKFNSSIQLLDEPSKAAFQKLNTLPDVLDLLTANPTLTKRLSANYASNPSRVEGELSALHDSLIIQNQFETAAFKKQMADNPDAMTELNHASKDYAYANGYTQPDQQYYNGNNATVYYGNPYSYWFGYPTWFASPMWYPGSFGFNSGFYGGYGGFGLNGFPSYGFSEWFFNGGYYHRYPRLYMQFGNYYHSNMNGHRFMGSANAGFMGIAHTHYAMPGRRSNLNFLQNHADFRRPGGMPFQSNGLYNHSNSNSYHGQGWGNFGGGRGNFGGGKGFQGGVHMQGGRHR